MKSLIKNRRGQVAIFVALIFQLLFLFFAMVVNVGLLVHHKINLQNSVDLAAYYGASKQAEMLNAMAHVNYQIRQSWKLLAWRYRVIGSGGDRTIDGNPYDYNNRFNQFLRPDIPDDLDDESPSAIKKTYYRMPSFCVDYTPFQPAQKDDAQNNQNTCKSVSNNQFNITNIKVPVLSDNSNYARSIRTATQLARNTQTKNCLEAGPYNFATLMAFTVGFNFDAYARRFLIAQMSKALSEGEKNFYDIDGESAADGIRRTLENNLTEANREGYQMEILNGLHGCHGSPGPQEAAAWLKDIPIYPFMTYMDNLSSADNASDSSQHCSFRPKLFSSDFLPVAMSSNAVNSELKQYITDYKDFVGLPRPPQNFTLGYEKNPWCMAYVGVKATAKPRIPFAPLDITLSAKSFAKPFGGRFGPSHYKDWPAGSPNSVDSPTTKTDAMAPARLVGVDQQALQKFVDDLSQGIANGSQITEVGANYSRFPGDKLGLMSQRLLGEYTRAVHSVADATDQSKKVLDIRYWYHLTDPIQGNESTDMLYWNPVSKRSEYLRELEAAAIAPDIYDISYYSIDPNFYENYYERIKKGTLLQRLRYQFPLRSDLGSRLDSEGANAKLQKFSIRDQIRLFEKFAKTTFGGGEVFLQPKVAAHTLMDSFQVLTSWTAKDLLTYGSVADANREYFGRCKIATDSTNPNAQKSIEGISRDRFTPAPGDCVVGGRTGYSVKLVSGDFLKQANLELTGEGRGSGAILNPPDPSW